VEAVPCPLASRQDLCAFGHRVGEVLFDDRELLLVAYGAKRGPSISARRRHVEPPRGLGKHGDKTIGDWFEDVDTFYCAAVLTSVVEGPVEDSGDRSLEITIG